MSGAANTQLGGDAVLLDCLPPERCPHTTRLVPASHLEVGMLLELEGCPYADVPGTGDAARHSFPYELVAVLGTERETAACVRVDTDCGSWGYPHDHELTVVTQLAGEQ